MPKSNLGISLAGRQIENGSISLDLTVDNYPTLSISEYNSTVRFNIGDTTSVGGLDFYLESISIDQPHIGLGLESNINYSYVHVSKRLCEYPVFSKEFADNNKGSAIRQNTNSYFFDLRDLVQFVKGKVKSNADVSIPSSFEIEISKTVEATESITIKQYLDSYIEQKGLVMMAKGNALRLVKIGSGGSVGNKLVSNINIVTNAVTGYKNTVLEWDKESENDNRKKISSSLGEYCIYDGDYQPHLPPSETEDKVPRDLSIMIDNSGLTKQFKLTKYKFNQPEVEISGLFGYAHCALELVADPLETTSSSNALLDSLDDGVVTSGNAYQEFLTSVKSQQYGFPDDANFSNEIVWRLLEVKETRYIYDYVNPVISPQIKNPDGTLQTIQIAEEYRGLIGNRVQVLVAQETNGWEVKRFAQEDSTNWTEGSIDAWINLKGIIDNKDTILANTDKTSIQLYNYLLYNAKVKLEQYLYRKIPVFERIDYAIEPFSKYYIDGDKVDWQVEYIPKNKTSLSTTGDEEETIPVLIPDLNWSPNLLVTAQSRYKSSIGISGNPEYDPFTRNYWGSNPITITTGSEEYEFIKYSILPSKNTKPTISSMYQSFNSLDDLLSSLETNQNVAGTYYKPHSYMNINDYGLANTQLQQLNFNITSLFPSNRIKAEDSYLTATTYRNAQDNSFKSNITTSNFNVSQGRPPSATIRKPTYDEVDIEDKDNPLSGTITYITEVDNPQISNYAATTEFSNVTSLDEAIESAKNKLKLERFKSGDSCSGQLDFELANKVGIINSSISIPTKLNRKWVIKRCNLTVQYTDGQSFGQPVTFEAGSVQDINLTSKTVPVYQDKDTDNSGVELNVKIGLEPIYGTPKEKIPNGFSRWVDTN